MRPKPGVIFFNTILLLLCFNSFHFQVLAQNVVTKETPTDGYVHKYNHTFRGIGPEVYILPAAKSKKEALQENYAEIGAFQDSIVQALRFQELLTAFKYTSNMALVEQRLSTIPPDSLNWDSLIDLDRNPEDRSLIYGFMNVYAKVSLLHNNTSRAKSLLDSALQIAMQQQNSGDMATIQANLASVYLYDRNSEQAGRYEAAYLQQAAVRKNLVDQAKSWVKIAYIQAYNNDYKTAENSIIRKAIPLFNKSKDYEGKIGAWVSLATIYQMQQKHTEAQWFLLQARDLANSKKIDHELSEILYRLGSSKLVQKNLDISRKELEQALQLAQEQGNKYLQLAIQEKLGQINLQQNKVAEAEQNLASYWKMRKELFVN
ncbi:tetratricopeptide repeat protein [Sphingobacterium sp. Mn56C]|uniref:tetratricopeptide repeat protein n=1 Tax=Sphingobacterium sp. Mn56C TaxID=3395261 RepID=UPI003BE277A9